MTTAFALPAGLEASAPPTTRDGVRLLVAGPEGVVHARFAKLAEYLRPGDLVVVNTSGTLAAAVEGVRGDGRPVTVHIAQLLDPRRRGPIIELRPAGHAEGPLTDTRAGDVITLPDGLRMHVVAPHPAGQHRLWRADAAVDGGLAAYLARHGRPIRYSYVAEDFPLADYQTVFAREPGSAEMPSAGRPFTDALVTELATRGIGVAPITLHTGVSSPEAGEPPQPEPFRVPAATATLANHTRAGGGRVVAVGTTVTRALESAADRDGLLRPRSGWTDLVLGADRPARAVGGLVTGWHAPGASHLHLLEAVAGAELVDRAYAAALGARYLWHEFGDSCLLLP